MICKQKLSQSGLKVVILKISFLVDLHFYMRENKIIVFRVQQSGDLGCVRHSILICFFFLIGVHSSTLCVCKIKKTYFFSNVATDIHFLTLQIQK